MQVIPISPTPSQTVQCVLAGQSCRINIFQKSTGVFVDLYVNDALIIAGVICRNKNRIVRSIYLGFIGDLVFFDMAGTDDPDYAGMGSRWILLYLAPADIGAVQFTLPAFTPIPEPAFGLILTGSNTGDLLNWPDVPGAMSYNLYWSTSPGVTIETGTKIENAGKPYAFVPYPTDAIYYFIVSVIDASNNETVLWSEATNLITWNNALGEALVWQNDSGQTIDWIVGI